MAAWFRNCRPIWSAFNLSRSAGLSPATSGCPTTAAQVGLTPSWHQIRKAHRNAVPVSDPDNQSETVSGVTHEEDGQKALLGAQKSLQESEGYRTNPKQQTSKRAPRTLSGWQRFLQEQFKERVELKQELKDPTAKIDVAKALADIGDKWQSLPAKEKQPYLDAAAASKPKPKPRTKGLSGYALFVKENFENVKARNPTIRPKEVLVNMGHEWKSKSDTDKAKYKKRAEEYNKTL
ncbi:hypothetical protein ABBQ32_005742 [Trebouxia sp. C0010 RCD-2024]